MQLQRYQYDPMRVCLALIVKEGRKWMQLLIIKGGRLKMIRCPMTAKDHMSPIQTNERKARATLRRLARKRGTPRNIRAVVAAL